MLDYKKYLESKMILLSLKLEKAKRRKNEERAKKKVTITKMKKMIT
jgi:hypothetical protein